MGAHNFSSDLEKKTWKSAEDWRACITLKPGQPVMFHGSHFILIAKQAATTTIFFQRSLGMTWSEVEPTSHTQGGHSTNESMESQ